MKLEYYPVEKLKKEILAILAKYLDLSQYRIFFFGSRVSGKSTDRSDIDIGIEGIKSVSLKNWFDIEEEVENIPTLYKIEIVDFKKIAPKFRKVSLEAIEPIIP